MNNRKRRVVLTEKQRSKLINDYLMGFRADELAFRYGISLQAVYKIIGKVKIKETK